MPSKVSQAVNVSAFICSATLVGLAIGIIYLASDAYDVLTSRFPPGTYGWNLSHWIGEREGYNILLGYNRSSEIKTYVAAAFSLALGLLGSVAFGLSFKRPAEPLLAISLLASAALACIVVIVCAAWSAVAEVNIKRSTCWFEPAEKNHQYYCSIENAACNALRFTDEVQNYDNIQGNHDNYIIIDHSCLSFRHARYLVVALAAVSLLLTGLYATQIWLARKRRRRMRVRTGESEFYSKTTKNRCKI